MRKRHSLEWGLLALLALVGLWGSAPRRAWGQTVILPEARLVRRLLAKAAPDEDFNGVGQPYQPGPPFDHQPKVNQAYAWGMAQAGDKVWIGTGANTICTLLGSYSDSLITQTIQTDSFVCEYGESQYDPALPPALGDWRPPEAFLYDAQTGATTSITIPSPLLTSTLGLRSAGIHDGVAFLGGPRFSVTGTVNGVNLFAFNADTGAFLGATTLTEYTNIRKWLVVGDVLYTATGAGTRGGSVLRWRGNAADPFHFEVVGALDSEGAELAFHEGRLFVLTWSSASEGNLGASDQAELYMSPPVSTTGLTEAYAAQWVKVWEVTDYEPDPVIASAYLGGGLVSFDGDLYWGTINFPVSGAIAHLRAYNRSGLIATLQAFNRAHRSTVLFRGRSFGTPDQTVELLYGEATLNAYSETGGWRLVPNAMGSAPLYGSSGFGNYYNAYIWSVGVFNNALYLGTFDWSYLAADGFGEVLSLMLELPFDLDLSPYLPAPQGYGADLYRISAPDAPATTVFTDGVKNYANYGIRNILGGEHLYLGTANPMNLMTDLTDDKPEGGWELLELIPLTERVYLPVVLR